MSLSECLIVRERGEAGKWKWKGLPVFLSKAFMWLGLIGTPHPVFSGAKISKIIKDKRIAIPDFPMTAALWMRIIFNELFAVKTQDIHWYNGRMKSKSPGGILGLDREPLPGISLRWLTANQTTDVMLGNGELDAALGWFRVQVMSPHHLRKLIAMAEPVLRATPGFRDSSPMAGGLS